MEVEVVKLSSRGQLVIPRDMRKELQLREGEKLIVVEENGTIVIRPVKKVGGEIMEELALAKNAADAWEEFEKGKYKELSKEKFLEELSKW
jgi:AbrB family looped-hinge helix DNA binding protein